MDIQVKRGEEPKRSAITPKMGEPVFTTDEKELYIGDGTTRGGIPIGTIKPSGSIVADALALFKDTTGKVLYAVTKSDFLQGYATEKFVTDHVTSSVPTIEVDKSKVAAKADDSDLLKGRSDYLTPDAITTSYQEDSSSKVVAASGVKALWTALKSLIDNLTLNKVDKASIVSSLTSTDAAKVLSAAAGKALNDEISVNATNIQTALSASSSNKSHLSRLPPRLTSGTGNPVGGSNGDVYLQYK